MDNFHIKSTKEMPTTHNIIINILLEFIEDLKQKP
jgi:hypothetical protein